MLVSFQAVTDVLCVGGKTRRNQPRLDQSAAMPKASSKHQALRCGRDGRLSMRISVDSLEKSLNSLLQGLWKQKREVEGCRP